MDKAIVFSLIVAMIMEVAFYLTPLGYYQPIDHPILSFTFGMVSFGVILGIIAIIKDEKVF